MGILHIANAHFEWELQQKKPLSIDKSLEQNPFFLQLQFLPFLYTDPGDGVAVTHAPSPDYWKRWEKTNKAHARCHLFNDKESLSYTHVDAWGSSPSITQWAKEHHLSFTIPSWEIVKKVNSKEFSFTESPKLYQAELLFTTDAVMHWLSLQKGPCVLKTCFGLSGKGHFLFDATHAYDPKRLANYLDREWEAGRPLIGEPWVDRLLDFSTQWEILQDQSVQYLGATICVNDAKGRYQKNRVGPKIFGNYAHYLEEHRAIALSLLQKIATLGYFGNVGCDAMLYRKEGTIALHPIVEINARKTMGWLALQIQQKHYPDRAIALSFDAPDPHKDSLLPHFLERADGTRAHFPKQLYIEM